MKLLPATAVLGLELLIVLTAQVPVNAQGRPADYWKPQAFETFLKQNPADEKNREFVLRWYGYADLQKNLDKLKYHTFKMVRYHPANGYIVYANSASFRVYPQFRMETISRIEKKIRQQPKSKVIHKIFFNLALLYSQAAIPLSNEPAERVRALRYFQLPPDSKLPVTVDLSAAYKAIHAYQNAIVSAKGKKFEPAFYSDQLASLYHYLGRNQEAIKVCEVALPQADDVSKPGLLVIYGRCLRSLNRIKEAKFVLDQVKTIDYNWYDDHGPGRETIEAEIELSSIALAQGDLAAADAHLLASVKPINPQYANRFVIQNNGNGLPIGFRLAEKLLAAKQNKVVAEYCQIILKKFWNDSTETKQLLKKATAAP